MIRHAEFGTEHEENLSFNCAYCLDAEIDRLRSKLEELLKDNSSLRAEIEVLKASMYDDRADSPGTQERNLKALRVENAKLRDECAKVAESVADHAHLHGQTVEEACRNIADVIRHPQT